MVECVAFFSRRDRRDMPKNRDVAVSAAVFKINSPGSTCQRLRATQKRLKNQLRRTKDLTKNGFNDISMTKKAGNKPKTRLFCLNVSMHNKPCNRCRSAKILTFLVVLVQNHQGLSSIGQQVSAEKGADKPPVVTGDPHLDSITIYIVHDRQVKSKMMIFLIWFLDPPCFFKSETRGYHQVSVRYLHVRWIMVRFPSLQVWWVCVILFAAEVCQAGSAWVFRSRRGGDKKNGRLDCVWIVWWDVPTCLPMCSTTWLYGICHPRSQHVTTCHNNKIQSFTTCTQGARPSNLPRRHGEKHCKTGWGSYHLHGWNTTHRLKRPL